MEKEVRPIRGVFNDPYAIAVICLSFVMVFIKKWEPGGNLDTVWYSALCRNIAETGDYFHFYISKYYLNPIFDHMPLSYWIIGSLMKVFGVSDFVARIYPMICSFFSYILVYKIGQYLKDKEFGLICVISYASCFGSSKWNGAVTHDVPLTAYFLAAFYTFLRGRENGKYFLWTALFFTLGVFTKGPIIFGLGVGILAWSLLEKDFSYLKSPYFYLAACLTILILMIPLLPSLRFDGQTVYQKFFAAKVGYLAPSGNDYWHYFAYFNLMVQTATLNLIPFFCTFWLIAKKKTGLSKNAVSILKLVLFVGLGIIIPLSFFKVKFPHYLLSAYPFLCIFSSPSLYVAYKWLTRKYPIDLPSTIKTLSMLAAFVFVALPIKTTGGRTKADLNLVNIIKLDSQIKNKDVYFYGGYSDDMIIFQTFKLNGGIDLRSLTGEEITKVDLKKSYIVILKNNLPLVFGQFKIEEKDCFISNGSRCVVTDPGSVSYTFPDAAYPQEIY